MKLEAVKPLWKAIIDFVMAYGDEKQLDLQTWLNKLTAEFAILTGWLPVLNPVPEGCEQNLENWDFYEEENYIDRRSVSNSTARDI